MFPARDAAFDGDVDCKETGAAEGCTGVESAAEGLESVEIGAGVVGDPEAGTSATVGCCILVCGVREPSGVDEGGRTPISPAETVLSAPPTREIEGSPVKGGVGVFVDDGDNAAGSGSALSVDASR